MIFDLPINERKTRNAAWWMHQGMWVLLVAFMALMVVVRRTGAVQSETFWIPAAAVSLFMLSVVLRDLMQKIGHRNTEDKLVNDVKTFLQAEPMTMPAKPAVEAPPAVPALKEEDSVLPIRADFVDFCAARIGRGPDADLVVFDAIPLRQQVAFKLDFHAVMSPVVAE